MSLRGSSAWTRTLMKQQEWTSQSGDWSNNSWFMGCNLTNAHSMGPSPHCRGRCEKTLTMSQTTDQVRVSKTCSIFLIFFLVYSSFLKWSCFSPSHILIICSWITGLSSFNMWKSDQKNFKHIQGNMNNHMLERMFKQVTCFISMSKQRLVSLCCCLAWPSCTGKPKPRTWIVWSSETNFGALAVCYMKGLLHKMWAVDGCTFRLFLKLVHHGCSATSDAFLVWTFET